MSIPFPQPFPKTFINDEGNEENEIFSVVSISKKIKIPELSSPIKSHKEIYDDLMEKFTIDYTPNNTLEDNDIGVFYETLMTQSANYATFMHDILSIDDKLLSFIRNVPASYMRADIYTGSKFNTVQYDSLAITRLIQLLSSSTSGFPVTNNPQSNTEKGKIDSYPIFSANRMVIRPRVYFGVRDDNFEKDQTETFYKLYPSLTELFAKEGYTDQGVATCFLILDIAQKQLKSESDEPDFRFPMEDIQDFGMIKASTVNHMFNFSIADQMKDFTLFENTKKSKKIENRLFKNTIENGLFIEYVEGGITSFGFSPPEHQHLKLEDLTQNREYTPWKNRSSPNSNITHADKSKPVYNPKILYVRKTGIKKGDGFIINNFDEWDNPQTVYLKRSKKESESDTKTKTVGILRFENNDLLLEGDAATITTRPFHGTTSFVDISDIKAEFKALGLILNDDDINYRDISNVDQKLMDNIRVRVPLKFEYDDGFKYDKNGKKKEKKEKPPLYKDRITLKNPERRSAVFDSESLTNVVNDINDELAKIDKEAMMWLFPYTGYEINDLGELVEIGLSDGFGTSETWRKHLLLVTYLDLLVKGIRYILWSLAKARFFAHIYIPIEYKKYGKTPHDGINYAIDIVEPGSSVRIMYDQDSSLFKTVDAPVVAFPIKGLEKGDKAYLPLYRSISRGNELVGTGETARLKNVSVSERIMTWYVSKKVTYIGADVGAMMRVEMTEGSLDWTLFYNEKNLLTQVSEHYLLNGLGNFRTGVF
jgi:hypothetical protein